MLIPAEHSPQPAPAASQRPVLALRYNIPPSGALLHEASTRVHAILPSDLPLACSPRMEQEPLSFPSSFEPRRLSTGRRTSRWGQAVEHGPGTTLTASAEPPINVVTHMRATSRRRNVRRRASKVAVRACGSVRRAARGSVPTAETGGTEYRSRRSLADRPVVAEKRLLAGVGVERRGRLTRMSNRSTGAMPWEEARRDMPKPEGKSFAIPKQLVWTSESKRARSNAFYLSPSPMARNHWESGPSGGRTTSTTPNRRRSARLQRDPRRSPLATPRNTCKCGRRGRRGAALQRSRTATNANRWISRVCSRRSREVRWQKV